MSMIPDNQHKEIPGNPSTAKSSEQKLRTHATADSLRVLTVDQWNFWIDNGYVVIKNAISKYQAKKLQNLYGNLMIKSPMIHQLGTQKQEQKLK